MLQQDIIDTQHMVALTRLALQGHDAFHRIHLGHQLGQNRRLVTGAGADFENFLRNAAAENQLGHPGDDEWLGNGLPVANG